MLTRLLFAAALAAVFAVPAVANLLAEHHYVRQATEVAEAVSDAP